MSDHSITWERLRKFFEVDNFGLPLPGYYAAAFDDFRETELRKARAEALREAAEAYGPGQLSGIFKPGDYTKIWLNDRADQEEGG